MITIAQRIEALRGEQGLSRPGLAAALGFPKNAIEKFETGRQTPSQEQQQKLADFFGVSLFYLRGESSDRTQMEDWMTTSFVVDEPVPQPVIKKKPKPVNPSAALDQGNVFDAFLGSKKFQEALHTAILDVLRSPEGQELLRKAVKK